MKYYEYVENLLLVFIFLFSTISFSIELSYSDLLKKQGLYFKNGSSMPFTGNITGLIVGSFIDGNKEGEHIKFYENGNILSKANFKKRDTSWEMARISL